MGRPVMLGNGSLTVGLNENGLVHDFYYPYVGLDNLNTSRQDNHKIGVWTEGTFSWVDDGTWQIEVDFSDKELISNVSFINEKLGIKILTNDFVDTDLNILFRQIRLLNTSANSREIRLFMHQVFQISRGGRGDTGLYEPEYNYILDYKGRCSLLSFGKNSDGRMFDQFAIGTYGIDGKAGTYVDAEDGELSNSPVEHGGVDSVVRFTNYIEGNSETNIDYWIIAADSQYSCEKIHKKILTEGLESRKKKTQEYWREWFEISKPTIDKLDEHDQIATRKSLMVIKAHIDKRGGIIASCDSSIYNYSRDYYSYVWPRDGAYAIWPLIRLGYTEEALNFFNFCRDILTNDGYLMHKYQPDRAIGSTWHPLLHGRHKELAIQEDETAIVVVMLGEYYKFTQDEDYLRNIYTTFIKPACDFMADFIDEETHLPHATYDLWEEKFLTTSYTTAVVYRALLTGVTFAEKFEFADDVVNWNKSAEKIHQGIDAFFNKERKLLRKGFLLQPDGSLKFDDVLDISSLYGCFIYNMQFENNEINDTVKTIESLLLDQSPSGGTPRYEHDNYFAQDPPYMGNPWFVTTLWMAQYYIKQGNNDKARHIVDWAYKNAYKSGVLSEQINPTNGSPVSVAPLVWSHAEVINTVLDLYKLQV